MKKLYKVSRVIEDKVEIIPFDKETCSNCSSSCNGCKVVLTAQNNRRLDLKPGMTVTANVLTSFQAFCNVITLLVPVLCAVGGFFLSDFFAGVLKVEATEGFKAVCVLAGLFIPGIIIFFFTRNKSNLVELQITGIVKD
ncbi:MAG: SoxR reducing system RseC family protein [Treponema sp.]|nr:SoxR reducing system RseC family protein [Treponema sp.]